MGLLNWIIENIQTLMEIPLRLLTRSLDYKEEYNHEWDCKSISLPIRYFEALQFLLIVSFVLLILLLGVFIGYRLNKWRTNTEKQEGDKNG